MPTLSENIRDIVALIGPHNLWHSAVYPLRKAAVETRWPRAGRGMRRLRRDRISDWRPMSGPVQAIRPTERGAEVESAHGRLEIVFFAPDLVRVRYLRAGHAAPEPAPYAIARPLEDWPVPEIATVQTDDAVFLGTGALTVGVPLATGAVFIADGRGRLLRADVDAAWSPTGALRHRVALHEDEHLFGLGERTTPGNRRGRTHVLWNTDPAGYRPGDDPINLNIPVYVGLLRETQEAYLAFYENPYYAEFDLGDTTPNVAEHRFAGGELRTYVAVGSPPRLLERYTDLTGRHRLQPLWMLGYHQSRWSYVPEARVRKLAEDFRTHEVPCDAIYLDIDYMDGFRDFTVDEERFPDLPGLTADLRQQGIKVVTMIDPGVKKDPDYEVYRALVEGDHACTLPDGTIFHAPVWPGLCAFPDFTAPRTRAWWGDLYASLIDAGVAGVWNDMNEPQAFSSGGDPTLPAPVQHALEGRGGTHAEAHNLYGMQMARATAEGLQRLRPNARPVVITRSGWAGVQRHATSWTADNASTWASLRLTVPMMLGLGLSGLGFSGPDVGGFAGDADGELFTRWLQMATFMPFFRAHSAKVNADQEPWSYGEPYLSINRRFIHLRYELLPYLYTALWQMTTHGWPMVRPLWWDAPQETALWDVDDAFLCGDALAVAPVGEPGARSRPVQLPPGLWYDFWTNRRREGGTPFEQVAPLETLPLYIRAGTVLPLGEVGPSVEQRLQKFIRLHLYPPVEESEAVSWLYEDAGEGTAYQEGEYRLSRFVMRRLDDRLTVTWEREGSYNSPYEHVALRLQGLRRMPQEVLADGEPFPVVSADPIRHAALLGVPLFETVEIRL
ncbi:MAG: TIM-barrel domain-containing protein [Anaerolineae bacterium]